MSKVNTGELLDFQDYSPEHNNRTARIDVEAVHTNQYNNTISNPNYAFEESKITEEPEAPPPSKNFSFLIAITIYENLNKVWSKL